MFWARQVISSLRAICFEIVITWLGVTAADCADAGVAAGVAIASAAKPQPAMTAALPENLFATLAQIPVTVSTPSERQK